VTENADLVTLTVYVNWIFR